MNPGEGTAVGTLHLFDANCSIGRRARAQPGSFHTVPRLLEEMEYVNIEQALVHHAVAEEYAPSVGNEMLMKEIKDTAQLRPCWVLLPHHAGMMPEPEKLIRDMLDRGVSAARLFPKSYDFPLSEWASGRLLAVLEEHRIPVFVRLDETSWQEIHEVCSHHRQLRLIVSEATSRAQSMYPLFEKFENLYLEISAYAVNRGLEEISQKFGARRLIFGSGMPVRAPGSALTRLAYAGTSEEEKRQIAGGNLRQLLERTG